MKVNLVLNGKDVCLGGLGPRAKKVVDFVLHIPNGKYFDADGIGECLKAPRGSVDQILRRNAGEIDGHFLLVPSATGNGKKLVYGSKQSIVDLHKRLQKADLI